MKIYKKGDIVIVKKKHSKWQLGWTKEMDYYIEKESVVMKDCVVYDNISKDTIPIDLLLKSFYDERIKIGLKNHISLAYAFPVASIDNRKEKIKRLLKIN